MLNSKLFVLMTAMLLAFGSTAHAKDDFYELSFSTIYTPGQLQFREIFEGFAEEVERRSEGSLVVNIFGAGSVVTPMEEANAVKSGNVDIAPMLSMELDKVPYYTLVQKLPDLSQTIEDTVNVGPALYSVPEVKAETDFYGIPIGFTSTMPQLLVSNSALIKVPADLKGKRVLVVGASTSILATEWGAIPVFVAVGDIYIGLQRGMGEAVLMGVSFIRGTKLYETSKYMTMINYPSTTYMPIIINRELFEEFSENQQTIIMETADEYFGERWLKSWENEYDIALKEFADAGVQVYYPTEEEMQLWTAASQRAIPKAIELSENSGLERADVLDFIDRSYDALEANGFEVDRYTGN